MVNLSFSLITFEYFLMILVRVATFVFVAPFFGMTNTPFRVKIGFSVFVSLLLFQILPKTGLDYQGVFGFAAIIVKEGITGLLIGFAASICNSIILLAGNMIDMEIGLSMATTFDPMTNSQVNITGNLYNYFILMLLIVTDMHHYILRAVVDSYQLIPIAGQNFDWEHLFTSFLAFVTDLFVIAFRIILPIFVVSMILNAILGIMAKVAPQMNMFAIGMQLKLLVGFVILFLTIRMLPNISNFIFEEMKRMIVSFIEGMY
ncbi:MAG: flagellar biosynthetic protein FliR [Lachnospiraceae bacterium]|nr:flagellar biosynthetic protein FliR [Lachnospiraceae bacterium]MDD6183521.1 flagellar biosynthetic protein FliR [Lachnospiraceae bacterium]MDD7378841.1 flagellar biosynthetic protein FliR [Lachnospiraceae bacterium]MDY4618228.1 flagellar biosynthetic protein FliR [Lachnospiraceae bacterium]MDY5775795.1 flagellar biosynthetic protein FliR [Lachnospiraceae bacterium]